MSHTIDLSIRSCHDLENLQIFLRDFQFALEHPDRQGTIGKLVPGHHREEMQGYRSLLDYIIEQAMEDGFIPAD